MSWPVLRVLRSFVREFHLNGLRWYVDNQRITERLRTRKPPRMRPSRVSWTQVNAQHGFDHDMQIEIEPFPDGVRVPKRSALFDS